MTKNTTLTDKEFHEILQEIRQLNNTHIQANEEYWDSMYNLEYGVLALLDSEENGVSEVLDNQLTITVSKPVSNKFTLFKQFLDSKNYPPQWDYESINCEETNTIELNISLDLLQEALASIK